MRNILSVLALIILLLIGCVNQNVEKTEDTSNQSPKEAAVDKPEPNQEEEKQLETEQAPIQEPAKEYRVNEETARIESLAESTEKIALITIDDAPDRESLEIAKILKELNVGAIFFVNGHFLETDEKKQLLKDIYEMGFVIGNHTYSHSNLKELSPDKQKEEIVKVNNLVEEITGERPRFFRAPFGQNTEYSKRVVVEEGMQRMNWTMGYDWEKAYQNKEALTKITLDSPNLYSGANLLMHDRTWTKEALPGIIKGLRTKGYKLIDPKQLQ